jgi:polyisoprenoid-binding protein YceI
MKTTLLLLTVATAFPEQLKLQPTGGSSMELFIEKTGLLKGKKHRFVFERFEGAIEMDRQSPTASRVHLSIDARSIACRDTWVSAKDLDKIQRVAYDEMLAAGKFPSITFRSGNIRHVAADRYDVHGELTIRDITRPAVVAVELKPDNIFAGSATVRMTDFGLKPPSAALGLIGTKDEMTLSFVLRATTMQWETD